jgi:hypothetical protein
LQTRVNNELSPGKKVAVAPKFLLTATVNWPTVSVLAVAMARAGGSVSVVCPADCPLPKVHSLDKVFRHHLFYPIKTLTAAIKAASPQLLIPCDDQAVAQLHELHALARRQGPEGEAIAELIEKSLGSPESYGIVRSRHDLLMSAREAGIRVPDTIRIGSEEDLKSWGSLRSLPWVLKMDGTSGGVGVKIMHTPEHAAQCFQKLAGSFDFGRVVKRWCLNGDAFWLWRWCSHAKPVISIQSFIQGRPANCAAVCWEGEVLAAIAVEVVSTVGETGHANVVRISDNTHMISAAQRMAKRLNLSGFFGLDFIIEEKTGLAYLIEMNPRPARPFNLQLGKGRDLVGALCGRVLEKPARELPPVTQNRMIAYFPDAWEANSQFLASSYHDIPEDEPDLVQELRRPKRPNLLWRLMNHAGPMKPFTHTSGSKASGWPFGRVFGA